MKRTREVVGKKKENEGTTTMEEGNKENNVQKDKRK